MKTIIYFFIITCGLFFACDTSKTKVEEPIFNFRYNLSTPDSTFLLPNILFEISGLSFNANNELGCVQDEKGSIFMYNLKENKIDKQITFGNDDDYEGIEFVDNDVYILSSNGKITWIKNVNTAQATTSTFDFPFDTDVDMEGLGYDLKTKNLLVACKASNNENDNDKKLIYGFNLETKTYYDFPLAIISKNSLLSFIKQQGLNELIFDISDDIPFNPSAITVDNNGYWYCLASKGKLLIVLNEEKNIVYVVKIEEYLLPKPEGIAFDKENNLYISSEGKDNMQGRILKFKLQ